MDEEFPAPRPLTTEERQFVVTVEESMRPAFIAAVADEFGPYGRPAAEIAERMSAAAPGQRLQTAVEARMNSGRHFDRFPAEERSAAAQQAVLAAANSIDSQLTVETSDSRLGELVGKGLDRMFRRQYAEVAHSAAGEAGLVLGGVLATAHLRQLQEVHRQAGSGVTPPTRRPASESVNTKATTDAAAARPPDRTRPTRNHERT